MAVGSEWPLYSTSSTSNTVAPVSSGAALPAPTRPMAVPGRR